MLLKNVNKVIQPVESKIKGWGGLGPISVISGTHYFDGQYLYPFCMRNLKAILQPQFANVNNPPSPFKRQTLPMITSSLSALLLHFCTQLTVQLTAITPIKKQPKKYKNLN